MSFLRRCRSTRFGHRAKTRREATLLTLSERDSRLGIRCTTSTSSSEEPHRLMLRTPYRLVHFVFSSTSFSVSRTIVHTALGVRACPRMCSNWAPLWRGCSCPAVAINSSDPSSSESPSRGFQPFILKQRAADRTTDGDDER